MKNIIKSFAALAAVLVSFASCQKEIKVAEEKSTEVGHYVEFTTAAPEAKTSFEIVGSAVNYSWSETDQTDPLGIRPEKFIVWENETAATSINAVLTDGQMHITAGFPGEEPYSAEYRAIFNPGVSSDQTCTGTTFDQGSDFLVSNVLYSGKNDLVFRFKRETGLAKIQLEGLAIGSQLLSVKIATDTTITGTYNIETGEFDDGKQAITIGTANAITTGEAQVYFSTVPFKNKNAKVIVETSNDGSSVAAKYVKVFSKPLSIVKGDVTAFSVDLTDCDVLWYESFDECAGLGGNDGKWSGSGIGSATISTDNADWDFTNGGGASACMKLGSSKNAGVATTPALGFTGNAVIKFRAGSWGSDATTINLRTTGGGTLSSSSVTPSTNAFGEYSVDLNGATAATQLTFEGAGKNNRFFLDEIRIYEGEAGSHSVSCATVDGGTLSASPTSAVQGTEITLTATPDAGYTFNNDWSAEDSDSNPVTVNDGKFTMPDKNVTVSGSFSKIPYAITKATVDHGSFTTTCSGAEVSTAGKGDVIELAYTPADGYILESWSVEETISGTAVTVYSTNKFTMPAAAVTVTANIKSGSSVPTYASLAELVAAGAPTTTAKKVNVTLTNDEITKLYKYSGNTRGLYFMAGGQEIEIYCSTAAPSTWEVGGTISGTLNNCDWKLYNTTWELCPADWSELSYTAPLPKCATPVITLTGASAAITCETEGVTIRYTVGTSPDDPTSTSGTVYTGAVTLTDGQTIKAIAYKDGYRNSDVASEEYVAGAAKTWTYAVSDTSPVFNDSAPITINSASWSISMGEKVGAPDVNGSINSYNKVKGWKWGNSGSKYWKSYTLSTDYFTSKKIKSVTVNFLNNGSKSGTMLVKQGTTTIGSDTKTFGATWTDLTASGTNGTSGTLTIQYTVAQASYIHSITVEYYD